MQQSPFAIRGVVEGFYGVYYTWPERNDLIRFSAQHGYNLYLYAPKEDRLHRARWWQPYPEATMRAFAQTVALAHSVGITFCYALHCTLPASMHVDAAVDAITRKLHDFLSIGVRSFSLLFDDLELAPDGSPLDPAHVAALHAVICNRVAAWLTLHDPACTLTMCPTDYHGTAPLSAYLHALGAALDPTIGIFYTGPEVCAPTITAADAAAFAQAAHRTPLIWDNYPVNDLAMRSELHLGPIAGRAADLHSAVAGIVVNPMPQVEASKIALHTYAAYLRDPHGYDSEAAWLEAIRAVAGAEHHAALARVAAYMRSSCLSANEPPRLAHLVGACVDAAGSDDHTRRALAQYLDQLDEDCYHLKYHLDNLRLRDNLLPWIDVLITWLWLGRRALQVLDCRAERRAEEAARAQVCATLAEIDQHPKRVDAQALRTLAEYVIATEPPVHWGAALLPTLSQISANIALAPATTRPSISS